MESNTLPITTEDSLGHKSIQRQIMSLFTVKRVKV